jgi:hypothetical protein
MELRKAREAEATGDLPSAWRFLERAHILGQFHAVLHLRVHCSMFMFAWRRRWWHELAGQVPRFLLAMPGSWFGSAPLGNTGGANAGILTPMSIPEDLQDLLQEVGERDKPRLPPSAYS